jgi:hypothetical protein
MKKRQKLTNRQDAGVSIIRKGQRYFRGLRVKEGRGDILVQPTKVDIAEARRHDPENCAYAICIKRMLQTSRVYVYTTVCYIQTLDEGGHEILERYVVKNHAHAYIQRFDKGEPVSPGGFILHKPTGSKTLDYKRKQSQRWAHDNPEKAREYAMRGYERTKIKRKRTQGQGVKREMIGTFRNGTGQVKFYGTHEGFLEVQKYETEEQD